MSAVLGSSVRSLGKRRGQGPSMACCAGLCAPTQGRGSHRLPTAAADTPQSSHVSHRQTLGRRHSILCYMEDCGLEGLQ